MAAIPATLLPILLLLQAVLHKSLHVIIGWMTYLLVTMY